MNEFTQNYYLLFKTANHKKNENMLKQKPR